MKRKYPASQTASVWIGDFTSEVEFDECVKELVEPQLRLPTELWKVSEIGVEQEMISIRELLTGFSHSDFFLEDAIAAAEKNGIESASSALVVYYLSLRDAPENWGALKLLGSFGDET